MLDKYDAKSFSDKLLSLSSFLHRVIAPTLSPPLNASPVPTKGLVPMYIKHKFDPKLHC